MVNAIVPAPLKWNHWRYLRSSIRAVKINLFTRFGLFLFKHTEHWVSSIFCGNSSIWITTDSKKRLSVQQMVDFTGIYGYFITNFFFQVLKLRNYFDINDILSYPQRFDIDTQLEELINNAEIQSNVVILSPEAEAAIKKLAQSELKDFSAYRFTDNVSSNDYIHFVLILTYRISFQLNPEITKHNLEDIAHKLTETADSIPPNSEFSDVRTSLKNQALHLSVYQQSLVSPMTTQTRELIELADTLEKNLKFNRDTFEEALREFMTEIRDAQRFINKEGTEFVRKVAKELVASFKEEINNYLNLVVNQTENDLGRCGPLANVYESMRVAGCNRIVNPLVGH